MKIVTYNVNGLRPRVAQFGSLLKLLNSLDADIICLQETKLSRQDLSVGLTFAEGYEGFLSCTRSNTRGRSAYSGVATFCRVKSAFASDEVALPIAAEEGFTGLLESSKNEDMKVGDFVIDPPLNVEDGLEDVNIEDLLKVDSEGRCVITDHGHFVLFNLYGPKADEDNKERVRFKLIFYKVLQRRWESLHREGRRIIVVGDLNIAPFAIDRCDADQDFEKNMFRKWLRSILKSSGGPFSDVFRSKHPERKEAYTYFSQRVGAEEFNYGSRIDHILVAGPCLHNELDVEGHTFMDCHVKECDIMIQFKRGNPQTTPKWQGGRTVKLDGSDHIPVYAELTDIANLYVHNTPPLALRYIPEVRGWQQKIVSFLTKRENIEVEDSSKRVVSQDYESSVVLTGTQKGQTVKRARHNSNSQLTIKDFFKQPKTPIGTDISNAKRQPQENIFEETATSSCANLSVSMDGETPCCSSRVEKGSAAILEWQKIQEKMKSSIPLCKGHKEPCVARSVKKGPNIGRGFYVCARAKGPESESEANCNYFKWASVKPKQNRN